MVAENELKCGLNPPNPHLPSIPKVDNGRRIMLKVLKEIKGVHDLPSIEDRYYYHHHHRSHHHRRAGDKYRYDGVKRGPDGSAVSQYSTNEQGL